MHDDDRAIEVLRAHLHELTPGDDVRARIATRATPATPATPATERAPRPRRVRRPKIAISLVLAGAAVVALAVALLPSSDSDRAKHHRVGLDTAAARELVRVGDTAANEPWGPLAPGQYYHLYSATVPGSPDINEMGGPGSREIWLDGTGHGQLLFVDGAIDPGRYPYINATGVVGGISTKPADHDVSLHEMLANPNFVSIAKLENPGLTAQRQYVRTHQGFRLVPGADWWGQSDAATTMRSFWGVTFHQIQELSQEGGPNMDDAVARLLAQLDSPNPRLATGAYGLTQDQLDLEQRMTTAARLLAAAPLPPQARKSLYRWLAAQPGAELDRSAKDAFGRRGIRVTFADTYDRHLPASSLTVRQLVQQAIAAGAHITPGVIVRENKRMAGFQVVPAGRVLHLFARHVQRTWRMSLVFDPDTSEVLQQELRSEQQSDAGVPELISTPHGGVTLAHGGGPNGAHEIMTGGGGVYASRNRATLDQPVTIVCETHPEICRL